MADDTSWMDALPSVAPTPEMQQTGAYKPPPSKSAETPPQPQTAAPEPTSDPVESAVIDVGGPHYSPSIPAGQQGSQTMIIKPSADDLKNAKPNKPATDSGTAWMDALPAVQPTPEMHMAQPRTKPPPVSSQVPQQTQPSPQQATQQPSQDNNLPTGWGSIPGQLAATIDAFQRGAVPSQAISVGNAAMQTPLRMITGMQGPVSAFREGYNADRKQHQELEQNYPTASTVGGVAGALGGGLATLPFTGLGTATGALPKLGAAASYLGRNAGLGAIYGGLGDDPGLKGAAEGAALGAALPAVHVLASPIMGAVRQVSPLWSQAAREQSVGNTLLNAKGASPIQGSPVGPLDMAQATNNPAITARADLAQASPFGSQLRQAQQQAVVNQIGKIGAPATAADASSTFTNTLRQGSKLAKTQENKLWNVPELSQATISPKPVQDAVSQAVGQMDPVFRDSMSPQLKALHNRLMNAGPTTVQDLNGIRSDLAGIARKSLDGSERATANIMSDAFMQGMNNAPELSSNPAISRAYQTARDYTRQMRTLFGTGDARALLSKDNGVYRKDASEGARQFFNFSNGSPEGPTSISELSDFISNLRHDPAAAIKTSEKLREAARSFVASALSRAATGATGDSLNPRAMIDFLQKNSAWMKSSGLFDQSQIEAADRLLEYGEMLRRPDVIKSAQKGSQTWARFNNANTYIDKIISPWITRSMGAVGTILPLMHGDVMSALEGGVAGHMVKNASEHVIGKAEAAMKQMMDEALMDPSVAKALMMKATQANKGFMSPRARAIIGSLTSPVTVVKAGQDVPKLPDNSTGAPGY